MKKTHQKIKKHTFRAKKRLVKVIKALLRIDQHTAYLAEAVEPVLQMLSMHRQETQTEQHPGKTMGAKTRPREFRESWLDKQEVMQLIPVSERSLYTLRKEGKLPSYQFKGKMFFKLQDIESLMRAKAS